MDQNSTQKQVLTLWLGPQSQKCATSFHNLQAQQLFPQEQDPISHTSLWSDVKKMEPRMLVYDLHIGRLAAVREVNNRKIIRKMQKEEGWAGLMGMFQKIDTEPLRKFQEAREEDQWPENNNWADKQSNYFVIDQGYTSIPVNPKQTPDLELQRFHIFEQFYRINRDESQNRVRRQLERTDFLKVFSICTDENYSGFTSKLIENLREECPKKVYMVSSLSATSTLPIVSLAKMYEEADILLPISTIAPKFPYFKDSTLSKTLAPLFSSLLTPFCMKDIDPYFYMSTIISDNRRLFNAAYTLPLIDTDLNLHRATNIFRLEQAFMRRSKNKESKLTAQQILNKYEKMSKKDPHEEQEEEEIRINFTNESYLALSDCKNKGRFLSESYVMKGHFKDFQKTFQPKSEPSSLSIKYLQGIFSACDEPTSYYDPFYQSEYGQQVQAYPYHINMFSHENFGESLRKNLSLTKKVKLFNEEWPECREKIMHIADSYSELHEQSD